MYIKDELLKAVNDDNIELIRIISKESLSKEQDDEVEYYYNYSVYNTNPKLLISFLDNKIISDKEKVITIFDHIIEYLKVGTLKENVERFFVNQSLANDIDIEPYLLDYYEFALGYEVSEEKKKYDVIIISNENKEEYKRSNHLIINLSNLPKYDRTYLASLIVLFKNSDLIIDTSKQSDKNIISKLAKCICKESLNKLIVTDNESIVKRKILKIDDNLIDVSFYDKDTNELLNEIQVKQNEKVIFPRVEKKGFILTGYYINNKEITSDYIFTKDTSVNIMYHSNTCKVSYYDEDTIIETKKVLYNTKIDELPIINKKGYVFEGWYIDNKFKTIFNELTIIKNDIKLYAKMIGKQAYKVEGKYVYIGRYPQSVVLDNKLIEELNTLSTNSNGYYEYDGKEYAKVVAEKQSYREYKFSDNKTNIIKGFTYYFLVKPIKWRVLSDKSNEYFLLSEYIIDKQVFYPNFGEIRTINGKSIYPNNYEYSTIREWLNNDFYDKAFSNDEKEQINETLIDNSIHSTKSKTNAYYYSDTKDRIFLLSCKEMKKTIYGFDSTEKESITRQAKLTDYTRTIGCMMNTHSYYFGNGDYWLRSPSNDCDFGTFDVYYDGDISEVNTFDSKQGVRPAMKIQK